MVNPKSLENLKKGGKGKHRRKVGGKTWKDLIDEYGQTGAPKDIATRVLSRDTATWREVVVGAAYYQAATGNAAVLRELMERSEPRDNWLLNLDLTQLPIEIVERIANGEDIRSILFANPRASGKDSP